jgi:organic radical activating enzyme
MIAITNAGDKSFNEISFGWLLTNWCNYDCSYCSSKGWLVDRIDRSKYRAALMVPFRLKSLDVDFTIDLAGGEPTTHPYLNQITKSLSEINHCKRIVINTNLSRSMRYYKNLYKHTKVLVAASYHSEYDSQEFRNKCLELKGDNFIVHININDDAAHWDKTLDLITFCKDNNIAYAFNSLNSTEYRTIKYTPECLNTFNGLNSTAKGSYRYQFADGTEKQLTSFEIKQQNMHKFVNYRCNTLKYQIGFDGQIRRECNNDKITAMFPKQKDLNKTITCTRTQGCDCDVMLNYYKELPDVYA